MILKNTNRIKRHKNFVSNFLRRLDQDQRKLCQNLTIQNKEEIVKKIIFKRELQKRYLRRLKLLKL